MSIAELNNKILNSNKTILEFIVNILYFVMILSLHCNILSSAGNSNE
jgi:hypothetical protein